MKKNLKNFKPMSKTTFYMIMALYLLLAIALFLLGLFLGYRSGEYNMANYMLSMVGKVNINGNVTINMNETKIDEALAEMKNLTIDILNKTNQNQTR